MIDAVVKEAGEREGVRCEVDHYWRVPYTPFAPELVDTVARAAQRVGARSRRIISGAGHDAH